MRILGLEVLDETTFTSTFTVDWQVCKKNINYSGRNYCNTYPIYDVLRWWHLLCRLSPGDEDWPPTTDSFLVKCVHIRWHYRELHECHHCPIWLNGRGQGGQTTRCSDKTVSSMLGSQSTLSMSLHTAQQNNIDKLPIYTVFRKVTPKLKSL